MFNRVGYCGIVCAFNRTFAGNTSVILITEWWENEQRTTSRPAVTLNPYYTPYLNLFSTTQSMFPAHSHLLNKIDVMWEISMIKVLLKAVCDVWRNTNHSFTATILLCAIPGGTVVLVVQGNTWLTTCGYLVFTISACWLHPWHVLWSWWKDLHKQPNCEGVHSILARCLWEPKDLLWNILVRPTVMLSKAYLKFSSVQRNTNHEEKATGILWWSDTERNTWLFFISEMDFEDV